MNGVIIPNTPIAVDFWQIRRCNNVRLFFLSHMHSDHTIGLSSTWMHPLYCSPVTSKILQHKLKVNSKLIHPLEVDHCHVLPLDDMGKETVTVTLIDANHCPGSVMFLFEGYFGTILYTGDFRYSPSMVTFPPLCKKKTIDVLYLDNTNCKPDQKLPSRQEATDQIKEVIEKHPEHEIVIGLYSLGKESLLVDLAKTFKTWIVVSPQRLELLSILELEDVFTTEEGAGRIHVVEQSEVNYANMVRWNHTCPTIAILPTSRKVKVWHKDVHVVPYSDHSSFDELTEFVSKIEPCSIVPVVKTEKCEVLFKQYLNTLKEPCRVMIPESVKAFMKKKVGKEASAHLFKAPIVKRAARGVEFESPDKRSHCNVDFSTLQSKQKSTPKILDREPDLEVGQNHFLNSVEVKAGVLLSESRTIESNQEQTTFSNTSVQSDDGLFEMDSTIFWSPKNRNVSVMSEASLLLPEAESAAHCSSTTFSDIQFSFKHTVSDWEKVCRLSLLPLKNQKKTGPQNFQIQAEEYLKKFCSKESLF
ncbi:5' exonuclease Apollo [Spea bombifrons]|uniref:5' exonuclease Apollo n=1 Tax=Spea bombifrons TaxID=233779 RepID=UPI00234AE917|nr:5' exonuclease Apollo [Spea bombifrons]